MTTATPQPIAAAAPLDPDVRPVKHKRVSPQWMSLMAARIELAVTHRELERLIDERLIVARKVPGCRVKVSRPSLEALVRASTVVPPTGPESPPHQV